jgi:hypothetical protein
VIKEGYIMFKYILAALSVMVMGFTCLQANPARGFSQAKPEAEAKAFEGAKRGMSGKEGIGSRGGKGGGSLFGKYGLGGIGPAKITPGMPDYGQYKITTEMHKLEGLESGKIRGIKAIDLNIGSKKHRDFVKNRADARRN